MEYSLEPMAEEHREEVMGIFNHYVENTFQAYPEEKLPIAAYEMFLQIARSFPAVILRAPDGRVAGFGMLRAFHPMPTFRHTAEVGYFLHPEHTGKGQGTRILAHLTQEAKNMGINMLVASISSENPGSLSFHQKKGFTECGRFRDVWRKKGRTLDMVWVQKAI